MFELDQNSDLREADRGPYAILGSDQLTATLWKTGNQQIGWRYRFNLFRLTSQGRVSQRFRPSDVFSLVKVARVLAAVLADDGCLAPTLRHELTCLAADLDQLIPPEE